MRTLKKVLALTVALATLFSLTAFAGYTDESKIDSTLVSDVNLLGAVKIMSGNADGSFNPTGVIKRSEAAKMIYVLLQNGNDDKATGFANMNLFDDVASGAWYAGYVNYCATLGIIEGVATRKFGPEQTLTASQLAKMLLVVAGYKSDAQGYTGANWQNNVLRDAMSANLFVNFKSSFVGPVARQWAAKMFANAITKTNTVSYFGGELITAGTLGAAAVTVGEKYLNFKSVEAVLTGTGHVALNASVGNATLNPTAVAISAVDKTGASVATFKAGYVAPASLLGQYVTIIYNNDTKAVFDVYASGTSKVYNVNASDLTCTYAAEDASMTIAFEGYAKTTYTAAEVEAMKAYYTDNYNTQSCAIRWMKALTGANYNNMLTLVDKDGNGKFDTVFVNRVAYGVVVKNDAAKTTLELSGNTSFNTSVKDTYNAINFKDTVVKGDVVALTVDVTSGKAVNTVAKITPVKATYTKVASSTYTLGGVDYKVSADAVSGLNVGSVLASGNLGKEFNVYSDGKYMVYVAAYSADSTVVLGNYALVTASAKASGDISNVFGGYTPAKVQLLLANGETKIYEYKAYKTSGEKPTGYVDAAANENGTAFTAGTVYEYVLVDGQVYFKAVASIENVVTVATGKNLSYAKTTNTFTSAQDSAVIAKATADTYVFVTVSGETPKYSVVKASELGKDYTAGNAGTGALVYSTVGGVNYTVFAQMTVATAPGAVATDFVYVTGAKYQEWDATANKTVSKIPAINSKGEVVALTSDQNPTANKVYSVTTTNGVTTFAAAGDAWVVSSVLGYNDGTLSVTGALYTVNSDTKVVYLDGVKVTTGTGFPVAVSSANNIVLQVKDGVVLAAFVEVNGAALDIKGTI